MYQLNTRENARNNRLTVIVAGVILTALALIAGSLGPRHAQAQEETSINVGTYDPQSVFEQHPAQKELEQLMNSLQAKAEQAQGEEGGTAELQRLQAQYEQTRTRLVEQFHGDIEKVMPAAAKAADVSVVAVELIYKGNDVNVKDITSEIIKRFKEDTGDQGETPPAAPQFPPLQQQ
jgi:Skp family chaperone for outer membrane proteins